MNQFLISAMTDPMILKMASGIDTINKLEKPAYFFKPTPNRLYLVQKGGQFERVIGDIPGHFINDPEHKYYDENFDPWEILSIPKGREREFTLEKLSFIKNDGIRKRCERLGLIYLGGKPGIFKLANWKMSWTEFQNNQVRSRGNEHTNHYRFKYQYYTTAKVRTGAVLEKNNEMIPIEIKVLYTLEITNAYKFHYESANSLEIVDEKIESTIRDIVGAQTIDWVNHTKHETDENGISVLCEKAINEHLEIKKLGVKLSDITYIGFDFWGSNAKQLSEMFETARLAKEKAEAMQTENEALFGKEKAHQGLLTNLKEMPEIADKYYANKNAELMSQALKETSASVIVLGGNNTGLGNAITAAEAAKHTQKKQQKPKNHK